ncbi:GYDIA family GHMP kinase [Flavivirga eckloniae]|uniref:GIY-YIG domain-containing protein n=1 Tax=Flavivirga eckloniae TaxID=1803846 RepID=A0A2K9PNH8_9FLAO|nr:GYDIA family GHMP kinase [Flavivirga eckloniae]AUP78585.1 hypothetical protein C1H87_07615 [Flavivirga eckloniae]
MPKGFLYILECFDGTFYTGSTIDLDKRLHEHQNGRGANHTKKRLPVKLVYVQEFSRIDDAFYREKQIQGWSRKKKQALIENNFDNLKKYSECMNDSHYKEWLRLRSATEQGNKNEANQQPVTERSRNHDNEKNSMHSAAKNNNKEETIQPVTERSRSYHSNGKLLLTGEYVVLDGAVSLAIPTKYGQSLEIEAISEPKLIWKSLDENKAIWFETIFEIANNKISDAVRNDNNVSERLIQIFNAVKQLNPNFLNTNNGFKITTTLDFPRHWGLGTSSTLINNIAQWINIDAYKLLENTFGGSGYDIACAQHNTPITYQLENGNPRVTPIDFNPSFKDNLYFVYLNKKQNSRDGIKHYNAHKGNLKPVIEDINNITSQLIASSSLEVFEALITQHETIISKLTKQKTVKEVFFNDFKGSIKSLGAWGGDFILASSKENPTSYFNQKGFETVIRYTDMVLN